jgi:hypothetical protein
MKPQRKRRHHMTITGTNQGGEVILPSIIRFSLRGGVR